MKRFRVLFLTNIPSPNRVMFFNELGKYCDLTVTFELKRSSERDKEWVGEKISNLRPIFMKGFQTTADTALCPGIISIVKKSWDYIIIGMYNSPTSMLAMQYLIITGGKYWIEADGGFIKEDKKIVYTIKKYYISHAYSWFSSGEMTTRYLVNYGADKDRCHWFPFTSVKESDIRPIEFYRDENRNKAKKELNIPEQRAVICIGRFIYGKGIDNLIKASQIINIDVGIYIIGGSPTQEYKHLAEIYGKSRIHFIGFMKKDRLQQYYRAADIFVLPTRKDVWGLVINEAMACALPVITTNRCNAGLEMIKPGVNGYIVGVDKIEELGNSINKCLKDENMRRCGLESYRVAKNYTIEKMVQEHIKQFKIDHDKYNTRK